MLLSIFGEHGLVGNTPNMHIRLVSTDKSLYKLCRETLTGFRGNDWILNLGATPAGGASPDLVIWDCDSDVPLPKELDFDQERKNLFLVSRKKMTVLLERLPMAAMRAGVSAMPG